MTKWFHIFGCVVIVIFISTSTIFAFESTLGLKGGAATYLGDVKKQTVTYYGGLSFDYWIKEQFSVGLLAYSAHLQARENDYYFETPVHSLAALLKGRPFGKYVVSPYLMGGVEGFLIDPNDGYGNPLPNKAEGKYRKFNWGFPVGGGVSFFVLENLTIDLEGMYHFTLTDFIDDLELGSGKDAFITASLGISFHFGKPKDTDGDGILDKDDLDPLRPEDFDGFEDTDGAPDLDNDKDGVPDELDHCPNTPENYQHPLW